MYSRSLITNVFIIAAALLLLGVIGSFWPALVGADDADPLRAPTALTNDAMTYQGYLTDENGEPLNGNFPMRFRIYNASAGGTLLWDGGNVNVAVKDGLFAVKLAIATDIFNGEALWVAHAVAGELLAPRQEILPAPMAHTLRPGAIVKGTGSALPNNYLLEVDMNNDVFAFNRGAVAARTTTGNAIYGLAANGRAVYGQTEDGYAVYGFDGGSTANRGYAGYFYSTNGVGVYGYSGANRSHPNILAPGIYGQSNQGVGVYGRGDTSNSHTFFNEGGYFEGGRGIYAHGTAADGSAGYGARIYSDNYRGMYVEGDINWFDAYFGGDTGISTFGVLDRSFRSQALVINLGESTIAAGDLVAMVGVAESIENGQPILAVAKVDAANRNAVVGVAVYAVSAEVVTREDGATAVDFARNDQPIAPDAYLVIITGGLAPAVNVSSLALMADGQVGDKISLSAGGEMRLANAGATEIVIGKVAGPVDRSTGTVPLLIDID